MVVYCNGPKHFQESATRVGEGCPLQLNAEEGSLVRKKGLPPAGCLSLIMQSPGKACQMLGKAYFSFCKVTKEMEKLSEVGYGMQDIHPSILQEHRVSGLPCSFNSIFLE